jgi:hypothetical protein
MLVWWSAAGGDEGVRGDWSGVGLSVDRFYSFRDLSVFNCDLCFHIPDDYLYRQKQGQKHKPRLFFVVVV